jgi:hypothetical protein
VQRRISHPRIARGSVALAFVSLPLIGIAVGLFAARAWACPFCSAVQQTLSEEIKGADAAIIAKLADPAKGAPAEVSSAPGADNQTKFKIVEVLKGKDLLGDKQRIEVLYFGDDDPKTDFLIIGTDPKDLAWGTPTALSPRASKYVTELVKLPESGADRLTFFEKYFEDSDPLLAGDAYDEFAKAPYPEIQELKDRLDHDKLVGWIKSPDVSTSRRRLYLTLLGVCGTKNDVVELEGMIRNDDRQLRSALDALIACYLNLRGADGLPLVEELFLKNQKAEYTDTYATIMALRFHGQETTIIPRDRLSASLRLMLDRPQLADLVIPDLARWEDWTVIDRLVELFKTANDESIWVRVPVINYLRACPLPEAKTQIEELAKIDPDAVKRASNFFPLGSAATPPKGAVRPKGDKKEDKATEDAESPSAEAVNEDEPALNEDANLDASNADDPFVQNLVAQNSESKDAAPEIPKAELNKSEDEAQIATPVAMPDGANPIVPPGNETEPGLGLVIPISLGTIAALFVVMMVILRGGAPRSA